MNPQPPTVQAGKTEFYLPGSTGDGPSEKLENLVVQIG